MWSGGLGRLAIHLGTSATHEPRGNASIASLGRMLCRVKILGTRGDSSPTAASEKEIIAEYQIVGKSANGPTTPEVPRGTAMRGRVYRKYRNDTRGARGYRYRGRRGGLSGT